MDFLRIAGVRSHVDYPGNTRRLAVFCHILILLQSYHLGKSPVFPKGTPPLISCKNLQGRSVVFDFDAIESANKELDLEIQRSDAGSGTKRARHLNQDREGMASMCKIMQDMRKETEENKEK